MAGQPMHEHATSAKRGNIAVRIDRLVIDGVSLSAGQPAQIHLALERELTRLLRRDGLSTQLTGETLPALAAPDIRVHARVRPAELGRQIARSLHASLRRTQ